MPISDQLQFGFKSGPQLILSINQELNKKALASPLPYFLEEGCCIFPAFFFQERYTCPKLCLEMVGTSGSCHWWSHFSRKKKKVHRNVNFRSDRGRFFPGIGSCKHLTARCERLLGSWMKPKEFDAFYSAPRTARIYLRAFKPFSSTQTQSPLHH